MTIPILADIIKDLKSGETRIVHIQQVVAIHATDAEGGGKRNQLEILTESVKNVGTSGLVDVVRQVKRDGEPWRA